MCHYDIKFNLRRKYVDTVCSKFLLVGNEIPKILTKVNGTVKSIGDKNAYSGK